MSFYNLMSLHNVRPTSQEKVIEDGEVMVLSNPEDIHTLLNSVSQTGMKAPVPAPAFSQQFPQYGLQSDTGIETERGEASLSIRIGQMEEKLEQYNKTFSEEVGIFAKDLGSLRAFLHSVLEAMQKTNRAVQDEMERHNALAKRLEELAEQQAAIQRDMQKVMNVVKEPGESWLKRIWGVGGGRE